MRRFFVRARRVLLLAVALAVAAALSGGTAAHAATAAGSPPCSLNPATSCQSTDGTVALSIDYSDASACTFAWHVDWGDGRVSDVTVTDPADGYVLLAQHTYANANTYTISATGQGTTENCDTTPFTGHFTLLKPAPAAATTCPSLRMFGVRGSGEGPKDDQGYGATIWAFKTELQHWVGGVQSSAINYPAISVEWYNPWYRTSYNGSVIDGVVTLLNAYVDYEHQCPGGRVVFAGYSQGADVVNRVWHDLSSQEQSRVILVTFGDPHFNPREPWADNGTYNPKLQAVLVHFWRDPPVSFPRGSRVQEYCSDGDPVCNYSAAWGAACVVSLIDNQCLHITVYRDVYAADGAFWAYQQWQKMPV